MTRQYIDHSVYPDVDDVSELPEMLTTAEAKADYIQRLCAAWDFDIYPEKETFVLLRQWKEIFDRYPIPESPAYHTFRQIFGWEEVPLVRNASVRLTYEVFDRREGRGPDACLPYI